MDSDFGTMVVRPKKKGEIIDRHKFRIKMIDILGNSITLENPEDILYEEPWEITKEEAIELFEFAENISKKRGEIISKSILIEDSLEQSIKFLLFGSKITEQSKLFENYILTNKFFMFENKRIVLRRMMKTLTRYEDSKFKDKFTEIKKAMDIRNRFAHGRFIFRGKKAYLSYIDEKGKTKEDELSNAYFDNINQRIVNAALISNEIFTIISGK